MPLDGLRVATILPAESPVRSVVEEHIKAQGGTLDDFNESSEWDGKDVDKYSLVVVDWRVPFSFEFIEKIKVPRRTSRTPVLGIYPANSDPEQWKSLTIVPEEELTDDVTPDQIVSRADRLLSLQRSRPRHFMQDMILRLPTTGDDIEKVCDLFEALLIELGYNEYDQTIMSHSFREAVGNAAEHGNGHNEEKVIRVVYMVDFEKMLVIVTDEGKGFDHEAYMRRVNDESALDTTTSRGDDVRPGGLGYHIMKQACDAITYNQSGNSIFLMKYLPGIKDEDED